MPLCIQICANSRPSAARLRELVLVVREDEVEPAAVDLEGRAEELLGHRRALDVPARPAPPPRRVPRRVLALLVRLPEREVPRILLQLARLLLLGRVARGSASSRPRARRSPVRGDAEVDVAAGGIGEAAVDQLLDEADDLGTVSVAFGCSSGRPRPRSSVSSRYQLRRALGELGAVPGRGVVDLVVDVRDVVDELDVVAALAEPAAEPHASDERARVADVGAR